MSRSPTPCVSLAGDARPSVAMADSVAFTVMEHIDNKHPAVWNAVDLAARVSIRNAIVLAVLAEHRRRRK